ncbi:MAG: D-alanyl-D-alanine carboxypeptidase [Solirubrobacteraceae bacterium]|nr:D-alanyl-D-alanine carboxypeptidase [Solirubrobacteraceae bacterium]
MPVVPMPRRRLHLVPIALLALVLVAGVAVGLHLAQQAASTGSGAPLDPETGSPLGAQQTANGPIAAPRLATGLKLRLNGTKDPFAFPFKDPPKAGLLFDLDTGEVFWRKNPNKKLAIASVTKMMTSLLVVDRLEPGTRVPVTKEALAYTGSGVGVLPKGKSVGLSAMLHGLLLASGNDTAIALAQKTSGSVDEFVDDMNLHAQAMGMRCSHYASPSGIVDKGNYSCATDLAIQARAILDNPRLAPIVARREAVLPFPIKGGKLYLYNHNPLLKQRYRGTLGVKTGYTDAAGKCIVVAVRRGKRRLGLVLLDSPDLAKQPMQIFDYAFRKLA